MRGPVHQSGFTLVELLTVIAIIAILAALLIPAAEVDLNDASLYYVDVDPLVAGADLPNVIVRKNLDSGTVSPDPKWNNSPVGYEAAAGLSPLAPASTTPLIWTRGLRSDGTWAPSSPWEGRGGHICFMDGHVEFFKNLGEGDDAVLINYADKSPTANIEEAINKSTGAIVVKPAVGGAP